MVYHYYDYNRVAVLQILNLNPTNKAFLQTKLREKGSTKKSVKLLNEMKLCLFSLLSYTGYFYNEVKIVQRNVINHLLTYCQPVCYFL